MSEQQELFTNEPETISLMDVFAMGVDYGQLLMEEERDNEDLYDAFQGMIISNKYSMSSAIAPRRQPHSDKWRAAKLKSKRDLIDLVGRLASGEKFELKPY